MKPILMMTTAALGAALAVMLSANPVDGCGHGFGGGGPPLTQSGQNGQHTITQTVNQDQLVEKEVDGLKGQQDALDKAAATYTGDAKLTKDELDALEESLDAASFFIWSKGVDDDGKVITLYGKSIFPIDALNKMFEDKTLTHPQAKMLLNALRNLATMKLKLNESLTVETRLTMQKQFNENLAKYYMKK